jgi:hypothetical protein
VSFDDAAGKKSESGKRMIEYEIHKKKENSRNAHKKWPDHSVYLTKASYEI